MKVLLVLFSYFPYGGLQRDFMKILKQCNSEGIACTVMTMSWEGEKPDDMEIIIPPVKGFSRVGQRNNFVKEMLKYKAESAPDIVFGFNKMPGLDFYFAADSCFAKKAFGQRSWLYRLAPRSKQYLAFESAVFGKYSRTVSFLLSPVQSQEYEECYPGCQSRLNMVPPGIETSRKFNHELYIKRSQIRKLLNVNDNDFLILQIGSGFSIKGVDRSLHAISSLPVKYKENTKYFLVGDDRPEKYINMAIELKIDNIFQVMGGREDIPEFLHAADLLLHPAYKESAGMVLLEAIISGLPVLTTASSGYAFHVEKAGAGKVCSDPFSQDELDSLLLQMLKNLPESQWHENGINYGKNTELYSLAQTVVSEIKHKASNIHD